MSKYFALFQHSEEKRLEKKRASLLKEKVSNLNRNLTIDEEVKAIDERLVEIKSKAKA